MTDLKYTTPFPHEARYDLDLDRYAEDAYLIMARGRPTEDSLALASMLSVSPDWEDRVRARVILANVELTLPDDFPCIVETEDSPDRLRYPGSSLNHIWMAHPDIELLHQILPEYQEMWDAYTAQWGPTARRKFGVERRDNVPVWQIRRQDATVDQILRAVANQQGFKPPIRLQQVKAKP